MARKKQNLKPDTVLKNYWNDNEQFADLFNAVLFDGKQVIKPKELEDIDTEESSVLEHRDYANPSKHPEIILKYKRNLLYMECSL